MLSCISDVVVYWYRRGVRCVDGKKVSLQTCSRRSQLRVVSKEKAGSTLPTTQPKSVHGQSSVWIFRKSSKSFLKVSFRKGWTKSIEEGPTIRGRGQVLQHNLLGEIPRTQGQRVSAWKRVPTCEPHLRRRLRQEHFVQASCGGHSKVMLYYSTGVMSILLRRKYLCA